MNNTQKIIEILEKEIPVAKSELNFENNFQLLCAVILSAQCTDKRVNQVTPQLFQVAPTPQKMMEIPLEQLEQLIHSCGFYHHKAVFLRDASKDIVEKFSGVVPNTLEDLMSLKGVGRKTANVVYAVGFNGQAIAVDTHVFRVANRLGLASAKTVEKTEEQLMQVLPRERWSNCHHLLLLHGRYTCKSQKPKCNDCSLTKYCKHFKQRENQDVY